jgi:diacylglycerol O-acyltransferase
MWIDTGGFDVDYHFRRVALPAPGGDVELCGLVARVMADRLDRDRPLWECWVVEGLADGRWAILSKVHHCMADGISGAMLQAALFAGTLAPGGAPPRAGRGRGRLWPGLGRAATDLVGGLGRMAEALVPSAPSSLCGPLGAARRYAVARASLADLRAVCSAFGVTVNDVVLTAISLAFRDLLRSRGERPASRIVRTMVPVSVGTHAVLDNQISVLLPVLPVDIPEPVLALREVHRRLTDLKGSKESEAGDTVTRLAGYEPYALISMALRLIGLLPQRGIVAVTTNVPGPVTPLAVLGRSVVELLPYVPIALRMRTGVAAMSYRDRMVFGVTADFDSCPDILAFTQELERGVASLVTAARAALASVKDA